MYKRWTKTKPCFNKTLHLIWTLTIWKVLMQIPKLSLCQTKTWKILENMWRTANNKKCLKKIWIKTLWFRPRANKEDYYWKIILIFYMFTDIQERMSTFSFVISYSWPNCVNNKMLESDWFLTDYIYSFILLQKFPIWPVLLPGACNWTGQIGQLKKQWKSSGKYH